jgi:Ca2+-binding RTX toxin-like protein
MPQPIAAPLSEPLMISLAVQAGTELDDTLRGTDQADTLSGLGGDDVLYGRAGNDLLLGGLDDDFVSGSEGNDSLYGDRGSDFILGGEGNDSLFGGDGSDNLRGEAGNDLISGGTGNDVLYSEAGNDTVFGGAGSDTIFGIGTGNDFLFGDADNDTLVGGGGNDYFSGGSGSDEYIEGSGSDSNIFIIQDIGDRISTGSGDINDTVRSFISYTLSPELGRLGLQGSGNLIGNGNGLSNTVVGNLGNNRLGGQAGNDTLMGGGGKDTLIGGIGSDTYYLENSGDIVSETSTITSEIDTVRSYISFGFGVNLERLSLQGTTNINATGNNQNNLLVGNAGSNLLIGQGGNDTLLGNAGNDVLVGVSGNDVLTGGSGSDSFNYVTGGAFVSGAIGVDLLTDFARTAGNTDKIKLSHITFSAGTTFSNVGSDALAQTSTAFITFSTSTGRLFYNQNGASAGLGTGGHFATLSDINGNPITRNNLLFTTDFVLI